MIVSQPGILSSKRREFISPYTWTSRTPGAISSAMRGVGYDGSTYWTAVNAATAGTSDLITSTDAITWTIQETALNNMRDIDNDGTTWTTVGDSGYMLTATDPTATWTSRTSGFGATGIQGVFWDGTTYWLAMGSSGTLTTATDPTGTWTSRTSSFGADFCRSCAFDGTTYVMVGGAGKLATATDPTGTWTQRTSSFGATDIRYVAYSPTLDLFCAVGASGKIGTAAGSDTTSWTQRTSPFGGGSIDTTVQWDATENLFVVVTNSSEIGLSQDGITWHLDTGGFANMWDLKYGDGFLVVVGDGPTIKTSFS